MTCKEPPYDPRDTYTQLQSKFSGRRIIIIRHYMHRHNDAVLSQVKGFSHLFRSLNFCTEFLATGRENKPQEIANMTSQRTPDTTPRVRGLYISVVMHTRNH